MEKAITKVSIIGAGTMGHGLAQAFAQGGHPVALFSRTDRTLERAMILVESSLGTMVEAGVMTQKEAGAALRRIQTTTSLEEATKDADLAIETVAEDKAAKEEIFEQLDQLCPPQTILASNTTFLNIFDFVRTFRQDQVLITHWYAPPQIIPLVDVVKGPYTDEANIRRVVAMLKEMGKKPVVFNKPLAGYVVSRMQIAFQRELYYIMDNDYLSVEDLDATAVWGLAMRMLVVGAIQRIDFGGLDISAKSLERASQSTPIDYKPKKLLELVKQGALGVKTGRGFYDYKGRSEAEVCHERDIRLLKLLKILKETDIAGPVL
jgi:3-hydroxybutyryl-CoA dehydrogenase